MKKFLFGTVAGGATAFILGFLVYGMALSSFMEQHNSMPMAETPDWLWMVLGHLFVGAFFTYIYLGHTTIRTFSGGARAGFFIGLLIALAWNSITYGTMPDMMDLTYVVVDSLVGGVLMAITGGVVATVIAR